MKILPTYISRHITAKRVALMYAAQLAINLARFAAPSPIGHQGWRNLVVLPGDHSDFSITAYGQHGTVRYNGVEAGDVIVRPFDDKYGPPAQLRFHRFLNRAMGAYHNSFGHAMVFVGMNNGQGQVLHFSPDARHGIEYSNISWQLGPDESNIFRIFRLGGSGEQREAALRFFRFHYMLAERGMVSFNTDGTRLGDPAQLPQPETFEGVVYRTYYPRLHCVGAIIAAYGLQPQAGALRSYYRHILPLTIPLAFAWSSPENLGRTALGYFDTARTLAETAVSEVQPEVVNRSE